METRGRCVRMRMENGVDTVAYECPRGRSARRRRDRRELCLQVACRCAYHALKQSPIPARTKQIIHKPE